MPELRKSEQQIPWWVGAILVPLIFLGLNGYLVATTKRLERAIDEQTALISKFAQLETKVSYLERSDVENQRRIQDIFLEQQARNARLAVLEAGLKRLETGQEQQAQRLTEIRDMLLRQSHPAPP
jgi:septal ring factor EnvC (AmiA/AmiB activator)